MLTDVTGSNATLGSITRPEPRTPQAPTPARQEPSTLERQVPTPDVQVDTRLDPRAISERSIVQEASSLAISQQSRGELALQIRFELDQLDGDGELPESLQQLADEAIETLQAVRERALSEPFGLGIDDLGPLADDNFFIRDRGSLSALEGTVSALERFSEFETPRLNELELEFNAFQDEQLTPGNSTIGSAEEAETVATAVQQQLSFENITDANGLTSIEASPVLDALQSDQSPAL